MTIDAILQNETHRRERFPVCEERVFLAHAGVTALPRAAAEAMADYADQGMRNQQENFEVWSDVARTRTLAGQLLGRRSSEIALLGPTALGLSMVANGFSWREGDEVVFYRDDYPANVYPWRGLSSRGVTPVAIETSRPGVITWGDIERVLTPRTRLVSLASCHFLSGYRPDIAGIGEALQKRGIRFCVDGIQTLGAFPFDCGPVDFVSADSHKWMLGPAGAGIVFVREERFEELQPTLLGSWNVVSPDFIARQDIDFEEGARRYEPGTLNFPGIAGMRASLELLLDAGIDRIAARLLELRGILLDRLQALGFVPILEDVPDANASGIVSVTRGDMDLKPVFDAMAAERIHVSLRKDRAGTAFLRFSPHFYNTEDEIDRALAVLQEALGRA